MKNLMFAGFTVALLAGASFAVAQTAGGAPPAEPARVPVRAPPPT